MRKMIDLSGKQFGKLIVISKDSIRNAQIYWKCKCDCGKEKIIQGAHLRSGHTTSCGCSWYDFGKTRVTWKGYGELPMALFKHIVNNAKKRNIPFDISIEYLWKLFLKQNRKCAVSGLDLDFTHGRNRHYKGTASLDRIDSSKGYRKNNVQWVHKDINWMKQDYSNDYFLNICKIIYEYQQLNTKILLDISSTSQDKEASTPLPASGFKF